MDIQKLEALYLRAKIEYYEGTPIMEDWEFDALENQLKELGSKVHEQVGSKRKDFDFTHPTRMLSLSKLQMEKNDDGTANYMYDEFHKWFGKRIKELQSKGVKVSNGSASISLLASPKFDGSAINIIYRDGVLESVLTRGSGTAGKNVTKRFASVLPRKIKVDGHIIEIRCECVIDTNLFDKKYLGTPEEGKFANARNFVAGVIGKDDYDEKKVSELTLIPLHFLVDGEQRKQIEFSIHPEFSIVHNKIFEFDGYVEMIKHFEKLRKSYNFQLDGVVIAFPESVRSILGENDHDPEWSLAIKFIPEGTVTTVNGIEWNIGKRGQFTPVVLLDPVQLAGTTVKRASGYNAGYVMDNMLGPGAIVSIAKAGDIIPEIQSIVSESTETYGLLSECPECGTSLEFDGIHLTCSNEECPGRLAKILAHGSGVLDLKGIGSERLKPFAKDFRNIWEVWCFTLDNGGDVLGKYGLEPGSRLNEIFVQAFENIKSIPYEKVIQILGFENVGRKVTQQLAREHAGLDFSYASLERALVDKLHTPEVESYIKGCVEHLELLGVTVDRPQAPKEDAGLTGVTLTGSPKVFGFPTKKEFLAKYPNLYEVDLKDATFLVTDDLSSTSSKMKTAAKKGIEIKTYGDF